MISLELDSRFVNAAIYIVVDVTCSVILISELQAIQSISTKLRLRQGKSINLQHTNMSVLAGGALKDDTPLFSILVMLNLLLLGVFFFLTLGVSGTTKDVVRPASRRYVTRLAVTGDEDPVRTRLNPTFFSGCVQSDGDGMENATSFRYYPTAFDVIGDARIKDLYTFTDESSAVVSVDVHNMLCQKHGNMKPLLLVKRCGKTKGQCSNMYVTEFIGLSVQNESSRFETIGSGYGLLVGYLTVTINVESRWASGYNRMICIERPRQGSVESPLLSFFNCVLGVWNKNMTEFRFRIGKASTLYKSLLQGEIQNPEISNSLTFRASSTEVVLGWNFEPNQEWVFRQAIIALGKDLIDARSFLDILVSRTLVAEDADGLQFLQEERIQITEITTVSFVGYVTVIVLSVILLFLKTCFRNSFAALLGVENICVDITTYNGLLELLQKAYIRWKQKELDRKEVKSGKVMQDGQEVYYADADCGGTEGPATPQDCTLGCCLGNSEVVHIRIPFEYMASHKPERSLSFVKIR
ncbi:hypothetical protein BWQ96_07690 [Gracilariopsis chorda]|uniref:Uncharacterized protein n=1 Tax=Gracilariopsis chorda TaxID=448386 RepID=A0A2V3IKH5_9FLOR|nr:hypothetical protein BWQ96_07690 [Gracilariopsis chorda]|eukprot:PXF42595.1 hypothetical protein BWQ96_07690 [Gracilariopsis chorda]